MPATAPARLLIVDDEKAQMEALCNTLGDEGYTTAGFSSAHEALAALREAEFDVVLTDMMMPEMDGISFLREALEIDPDLVGILMTGHGTIDTAVAAMKVGALDYILKPFKLSAAIPVLTRALAVRQLRMENIQLRDALGIYELSMAIASASDFTAILDKLADAAFEKSEHGEVCILVRTSDGRDLMAAAVRGARSGEMQGKRIANAGAVAEWVVRRRDSLADPNAWSDPLVAFTHPFHQFTNGIALPMFTGGALIGAMTFASSRTSRAVTAGQIKTLNVLVNSGASALARAQILGRLEERVAERTAQLEDRNRQMEEELRMARELQVAMLPHRFPSVPRDAPPGESALRFYSVYRPAGSVSGDFFDVIPLPEDRVGVFIGDVMGHDVRAALVTAMMRTLVREQSGANADPGVMLSEVNRHLQAIFKQAGTVIFATASYLVIDVKGRHVDYANAAHPAPIHVRGNGRDARPICRNGDAGPALGLFEQVNYKTHRMDLSEGDRIILFTDGLFEAEAANRDMYGEERLRVSIRDQMGLPAEELLNKLLAEARDFTGQRKFADDVCLLAVEVSGAGGSRGEN